MTTATVITTPTIISATPGTLIDVAMTVRPPPPYVLPEFDPGSQTWIRGYICLVDSSLSPPRQLLAWDGNTAGPGDIADQPFGVAGQAFGKLECTSCPVGASFTVTTNP
jgi:hypothetical protein